MRVLVLAALAGCGFSGPRVGAAPGIDAAVGDGGPVDAGAIVDGPPLPPLAVPHVPSGHATPGTDAIVLTGAIDTTQMTIAQSLPTGVLFEHVAQIGGGEIAILHARDLTIPSSTTVRVTGVRPLVILASTITIAGQLDAGAHLAAPGAGGNSGMGMGGDGGHDPGSSDGGGGGAGYGTKGAKGGTACTGSNSGAGGTAGVAVQTNTIALLVGGASGGLGGQGDCPAPTAGGGGGGAVQLSAYVSIAIEASGRINAGGGGGLGGAKCANDGSSGGGGGAGGAIVLNTFALELDGVVAANGGAGAGGGCFDSTAPGMSGADGQLSSAAATGGAGVSCGSDGGDGGASTAPAPGSDVDCGSNGGGGGGAVGRIALYIPKTGGTVAVTGVVSPASHQVDSP